MGIGLSRREGIEVHLSHQSGHWIEGLRRMGGFLSSMERGAQELSTPELQSPEPLLTLRIQ